jgi:predicted ATPase/DNA-binding SARP family transcriptional activator
MAPVCELRLLGPAEVRLGGEILRIGQRDWRALLFFLAAQGGMVAREVVHHLIWEGHPEEAAEGRLRRAEAGIRRSLAGLSILQVEGNFIGLDFTHLLVDQLEFQNLIDQAGSSPWQPPVQTLLTPEIYQLLSQAAALWRSARYLEGVSLPRTTRLSAWREQTARRMEHLRGSLLERLANHSFASGDLASALQLARQALENLPLAEDLHFLILQILVNLNRQAEARSHFESYQRCLRRDLDTAPPARIIDLYRQIRTGTTRHTHPFPTNRLKIRPSLQAPFVNREEVLQKLNQGLRQGGGMLIFGESGQGKTRLLREFAKTSALRPRLLVASCNPSESSLPFQPFIEILRNDILPDEWLSLPVAWASQLTMLLPELAMMRPDLDRPQVEVSPETTPGHARFILMEAIRQLFLFLAQGHHLMVCLDDAHWSDEATLATVAHLLERQPFLDRSLLVAAARQEEPNPHLTNILRALLATGKIQVINLPRLSTGDTGLLTRHVLGVEPSGQFTHQLAEDTGGNPLFILETLRAIKERESHPDLSGRPAFPLTGSLQSLIQTRLAQISPTAREALEAAAVLGASFESQVVARVTGLSEEKLQQALGELEQRMLIEPLIEPLLEPLTRESAPGKNDYTLVHHKIRELLLREINPLQKRLYHQRIARLLENLLSTPVSDKAAILAQHFEAGGEPALAFDHWVNAGRYARQLFSTADAYQAFLRADALAHTTPRLTDQQIHSLYDEWTETAFEIEDPASIRRQNTFLLKLGEERRSTMLIGTALDGLSDACLAENQFEEGLEYTERAIQYLEKSDNLFELMEAYNHRGVFLYMLDRIEAAGEAFQDALSLGAHTDDPMVLRARANAHYQISLISTFKGWPETGRLHADRSLADCKALNRASGQVAAYSALALSNYFLGQYQAALEACELGIALATRTQAWRMLGYLHAYRAMVELASGEIGAAEADSLQARALGERYGHKEITSVALRIYGDLFLQLGAPGQAVEYFRQALELSENLFLAADNRFRIGLALFASGQTEPGRRAIENSVQETEASGLHLVYILARQSLASIQNWEQDPESVERITAETIQETFVRGLKGTYLWARNLQGEIHLKNLNYAQALEIFTGVVRVAAEIPIPWLELSALRSLVRFIRFIGGDEQPYRAKMEAVLARLGSTVSQGPFYQAFLQFRERILAG